MACSAPRVCTEIASAVSPLMEGRTSKLASIPNARLPNIGTRPAMLMRTSARPPITGKPWKYWS